MIDGAELRGRVKMAKAAYEAAGRAFHVSFIAQMQRLGDGVVNLSNEKARARTKARIAAMPGILAVHVGRKGSQFQMEIIGYRTVDGRPAVMSEGIVQHRGSSPKDLPLFGTTVSHHALERMIQRLDDDAATTLVDIHAMMRLMMLSNEAFHVWKGQRHQLAIGTERGALALVDFDGLERLGTVVTVVDEGLLRPDQEALVARYLKGEATIHDAIEGGGAFGNGHEPGSSG